MDLNHTRLPIPPYLHILLIWKNEVFPAERLRSAVHGAEPPEAGNQADPQTPIFECLIIISPAAGLVNPGFR